MKDLKGKVVFITGAAGGVGSLLARILYQEEEASLILTDVREEPLLQLKESLVAANGDQSIEIIPADLSKDEEVERLGKAVSGRVDVFISNAGIVYSGPFENMGFRDFRKVIEINLMAAVHLTSILLPTLIERRGHIVFVASGTGLLAPAGLSAYSTSKYGLVGFSEALRAEVGDRVGISTICPAFIKTDIISHSINAQSGKTGSEKLERLDRMVKLLGSDAEKVCRIIIKSIKKNRKLVPVGFITKWLWYTKRIFPPLTDWGNRLLFRYLVKKGYL